MPGGGIGDALAGLRVPDGRVRHANDVLSRQKPVLPFDAVDFGKYLIRRPLDPLVGLPGGAVELQDPVGRAVVVHRPPAAGEGPVIAPVEAPVDLPPGGDLKGVDDVAEPPVGVVPGVVGELLKELALVYVPPAVEPGLPELAGQLLQGPEVAGLGGHQGLIVRAQGLDKGIVLRVLVFRIAPVDEQPLEVAVARAPGIQGVIGPFGEAVDPPDTGIDLHQPALLELSRLVGEPHIILSALVLAQVSVAGAIAEVDGAAAGKPEILVHALVFGDPRQHLLKGGNVIVEELLVGPSRNEHLDARKPEAQQHRLPPHEPALSAAPGPAVGHIPVALPQGQGLLFVGGRHPQLLIRHSLPPPPPAAPGCSPGSGPGPGPAAIWRCAFPAPGCPRQSGASAHPSGPSAPR